MSTFAASPPPLDRRRAPLRIAVRALLWRTRFLVAAVMLGLGASAAADAARPHPPPTVPVAVAAHSVGAGSVLAAKDVDVVQMPADLAPETSAASTEHVVGASLAVPVSRGTPLVSGVLVPDDLAGPTGTVVAAVRLADPTVASLLAAGMRVDVLAATPDGGHGDVVAKRALVLPTPTVAARDGVSAFAGPSSDEARPLLLAVQPDEVQGLAAASAGAVLSVVVVP